MRSLIVFAVLIITVCSQVEWDNEERPSLAGLAHNTHKKSNFGRQSAFNMPINTNDSLPRVVEVHSYDIVIEPYFTFGDIIPPKELEDTFEGSVSISFSVLNPTNRIELNSGVQISKTYITSSDAGKHTIKKQTTDDKKHLVIETVEQLKPNDKLTLHFKYTGRIRDTYSNYGLYKRCDRQNRKDCLVATFFETISARNVFPSFDDPYFKSTFKISLIHYKNAQAYSNAAVKKQSDHGKEKVLTEFEETPRMSTYLVAFAIGDFSEIQARSKSGVLIRAIAPSTYGFWLKHGLEQAVQCVDAMEKLTNVKYPLKKLDNLDTIQPNGAMENFGLIIYSGYMPIAANPTVHSSLWKTETICHEIAHQWFGDIVTAKQWGQEFLHEAFATLLQTQTIGSFPDYGDLMSNIEVIARQINVGLKAEHPVVDTISHFDDITYDLGSTLLHQVRHVLGDEKFYKALNIYQTKYYMKNADYLNLFDAFAEANDNKPLCGSLTVQKFAVPWFTNLGAPKVQIANSSLGIFFRVTSTAAGKAGKWNIPLFIYDLNYNKEHLLWLLEDGKLCSTDGFKPSITGNYIYNYEGKGASIHWYHTTLWNNIWAEKKLAANIPPKTRFTLISDQHKHSLILDKDDVYELIEETVKTTKDVKDLLLVLQLTYSLSSDRDDTKELYKKLGNEFDLSDTSITNRYIGGLALPTLSQLGNPNIAKQLQQRFNQFVSDCTNGDVKTCSKVVTDYRVGVYSYGTRSEEGKKFLTNYLNKLLALKDQFYHYEIDRVRLSLP